MAQKTMKQLFNERKKAVAKSNKIGFELDELIQKRWGFSFSDTDDDPIIDSLDYGTNSISFDEFVKRMDIYKHNFDASDGSFGCIP